MKRPVHRDGAETTSLIDRRNAKIRFQLWMITMSQEQLRGDRLRPSRSHRLYHHLNSLRDAYSRVLKQQADAWSNASLLDFGCGNMPYRPLFEPVVMDYHGSDLSGNELATLSINEDGTLPLDAGTYDIVLSSQVLEHVTDPALYLQEAYRVLKADGFLLLSTHGVWRFHPDPTDYWRWTSDGLRKQVTEAGFEITHFEGIMGPAATAIQLFQDTTRQSLPSFLRPAYFFTCQQLMAWFDHRQSKVVRDADACVYMLVARR